MINALLLTTALLLTSTTALAVTEDPQPSSDYAPQEVVEIIIDALKHNNPDAGDQGIATVFRFASPGNKENTGPLSRFTEMIKRGFADMLNHTDSEVSDMEINGNTALQTVWLTTSDGNEVGYLFQVGKQTGGEFDGIWMTEAVYPQPPRGQSI